MNTTIRLNSGYAIPSTMRGSDKNKETLFHDPAIAAIAKAHDKTPAEKKEYLRNCLSAKQ